MVWNDRARLLTTDFNKYLKRWSKDLELLRQNELLDESAFISFARDRGLILTGIVKGEPSQLHAHGRLLADGKLGSTLLFHPFRFYVLHHALSDARHLWPASIREWNETAELAILLEPIYWPEITGHLKYEPGDHELHMTRYKRKLLRLPATSTQTLGARFTGRCGLMRHEWIRMKNCTSCCGYPYGNNVRGCEVA